MPRTKSYVPLLCSYAESDKLGALDARWAESLYVRLLSKCDDAGHFLGSPHRVLCQLFAPQWERGKITVEDVAEALADLERVGLVRSYSVRGVAYVQILDVFRPVRSGRDPVISYPQPEEAEIGPDDPESAFGSQRLPTGSQRQTNGGQRQPDGDRCPPRARAIAQASVPSTQCSVSSEQHARAREASPEGENPDPAQRPPSTTLDPRSWSFGHAELDAAWAEWLEHQAQQERPPTEKALGKHWHQLVHHTPDLARAWIEDSIRLNKANLSEGVLKVCREAMATGRVLPGPGSPITDEERRIMGWD